MPGWGHGTALFASEQTNDGEAGGPSRSWLKLASFTAPEPEPEESSSDSNAPWATVAVVHAGSGHMRPTAAAFMGTNSDDENVTGVPPSSSFPRKRRRSPSSYSVSSSSGDHKKKKKKKKKGKKKSKKKGKKKGKSSKMKSKKKKHKRRKVEDHISKDVLRTAWVEAADPEMVAKKGWFSDYAGDKANLTFDTLYAQDVSSYRYKFRMVMGLPYTERIIWKKGMGVKEKKKKRKKYAGRYMAHEEDKHSLHMRVRPMSVMIGTPFASLNADVLPLSSGFDNEAPVEAENLEEQLTREAKEFNIKTRERPYDAELWLSFVKFQDKYIGMSRRQAQNPIREKKISIYERALEHCPNNVPLILGYLKEIGELWTPEEVDDTWQQKIVDQPSNEELWIAYLSHAQSRFSSFTYTDLHLLYSRAIASLDRERSRVCQDSVPDGGLALPMATTDRLTLARLEMLLLRIFLRAVAFEHQAGQTERAIGLFQALIEYTISSPPEFEDTPDNTGQDAAKLHAFAEYWESDAPRVGDEDDGGGWTNWHEREASGLLAVDTGADSVPTEVLGGGWGQWQEEAKKPVEQAPTVEVDGDDAARRAGLYAPYGNRVEDDASLVFQAWLDKELSREQSFALPCHSVDTTITMDTDIGAQDPERVVLFDDIADMMFNLPSQEARLRLVLSLLSFLGVHLPPSCRLSPESPLSRDRDSELVDARSIFDVISKLQSDGTVDWDGCPVPLDDARAAFVRNVFERSMKAFPSEPRLREALILFEAIQCKGSKTSEAKKAAKKMLKQDRDNLLLWHTYAQVELAAGNTSAARKVYEKVISMYSALLPWQRDQKKEVFLILTAFAELELAAGGGIGSGEGRTGALRVLCSLVEGSYDRKSPAASPAVLARARTWYKSAFESKSQSGAQALTEFTTAYALLEYLAVGIDGACNTFEEGIKAHKAMAGRVLDEEAVQKVLEGPAHESLHLAYIKRVHQHAAAVPTRPGLLRELLERALQLFPSHKIFLSLYVVGETRSQIAGRIRRYFDRVCDSAASPVLFLFAIRSEISRPGASERLTTLFEKAIDKACAPVIWRMYLEYQMARRNVREAERVFSRATSKMPWCKPLWLHGVKSLRKVVPPTTMHDVVEMMHDKELRIRTELEEILPERPDATPAPPPQARRDTPADERGDTHAQARADAASMKRAAREAEGLASPVSESESHRVFPSGPSLTGKVFPMPVQD